MSDVITLGETMGMFESVELGRLSQARDFRLRIGGAESNVAIGLARLGARVRWVGRVGADELGGRVSRELRAEGVEVRAIVDDVAQTGLMIKSRPISGVTAVTYYRGGSAGSRLSPDDVDADEIASARILHLSGITPALSSDAARAVEFAIECARSAGVPVSFDVNHRSSLWRDRDASPIYRRLVEGADILFAGEDEARLIVDAEDVSGLADQLAALGPSQVVIKRGALGCHARIDGVHSDVAAVPIVAVDTVGAGDAFVAGYLAEWCESAPASVRLATAVQAGAFACLGTGDWESLPTRADLAMLDRVDPVER